LSETLHRLDKVAYVRFASVYREFRDVEEFVAELQGPTQGPIENTSEAPHPPSTLPLPGEPHTLEK
jgi:hypothetical protein